MTMPVPGAVALNRAAMVSLIALIALCVAWEMWLAPLRPGGSWLILKALPLLLPLPGILRARRYTHQWASMLVLAYLGEGLVRSTSDHGLSAALAVLEVLFAGLNFLACALFARATRPSRLAGSGG
jgi:uncharacterized membrane protein